MNTVLTVESPAKTFSLSQKQLEGCKSPKKIAVNDLSFELRRGEIFGLLGTNGAGKTTALRMIATLIKPDCGKIRLMGIDAVKEPAKVRSKLGFLTSELKLEDFFTPNYMFDYFSSLHGVEPAVAKERKQMLFQRLGIDRFAEVKIGELSTGMKQKVSIAVSLVHDPELVIFDEPTNGLDIITAKMVTDFLISLKEAGKSVVISSHIFDLIEKTCDRVGIVMDGKMVFTGEVKEILEKETLEETFFRVYEEEMGGMGNV